MPLHDLSILQDRVLLWGEFWSKGRRRNPSLGEYKSLFDCSSKAELSQDVHEGPALASGLSDVSGHAVKGHSLQLKKGQQARQRDLPAEVSRVGGPKMLNGGHLYISVTVEQAQEKA
uniref:Uncharacterized protein n=1 Tax=Nomascus leucogenys TaxID=61853 RepID=A0A2I3H839_NOMLE